MFHSWLVDNHLEKYEFVNGWWIIPYMKWKIKAMFETTRLFTHYSPIFSHTFSWSNGMSWMQNSTKPRGSILSRTLAESSAEPLHELVIFAPKKRGKRPLFFCWLQDWSSISVWFFFWVQKNFKIISFPIGWNFLTTTASRDRQTLPSFMWLGNS